jgi:hypothetical protein
MDKEYVEKIAALEKCDSLTDWERGFVEGDSEHPPLRERENLSVKQKGIVDRIHAERVQGKARGEIELTYGNARVLGRPKGKAYVVVLDGTMVGPDMRQNEAVSVVAWLSAVIDRILPVANAKQEASEEEGFPGE